MYQVIMLIFNFSIKSVGFWERVTLFDILLLGIVVILIISLIIVTVNKKNNRHWNNGGIMYRFILLIVNATIDFIGYFVNSFAFIFIFGDPRNFWGGGALDEILLGIIAFLIISLINVTVNMKIYRHWNHAGSYKSKNFLIPICAYILFDILVPLYYVFIW